MVFEIVRGVIVGKIGGKVVQEVTKRIPVKSSAIHRIGYNPESRELTVTFRNGSYTYSNVPPEVYAGFVAASSKGSYFNAYIKGVYD